MREAGQEDAVEVAEVVALEAVDVCTIKLGIEGEREVEESEEAILLVNGR